MPRNIEALSCHQAKGLETQLVVWDNASTDGTAECDLWEKQRDSVTFRRNEKNVGILGNPIEIARNADCDYLWVIGDDDIIETSGIQWIEQTLENKSPDFFALNCRPIKAGFLPSYSPRIFSRDINKLYKAWEVTTSSKLFYTAHYGICMRLELARDMFGTYGGGEYFGDFNATIPTTEYVLQRSNDLTCCTNREASITAFQEVSWAKHALKYNLQIIPEIFKRIRDGKLYIGEELEYWEKEHLSAVLRDLATMVKRKISFSSAGIDKQVMLDAFSSLHCMRDMTIVTEAIQEIALYG